MNQTLPLSFIAVVVNVSSAFTEPSFRNFSHLAAGWILCTGRHTISKVLLFASLGPPEVHHSVFYNFLARARWTVDEVSRQMFTLALRFVPPGPLYLVIDDTLCRHGGPHIWGAGMHHDPLASNYQRGGKGRGAKVFSCGHCFVIICLWIPLPWHQDKGLALPMAFRLYRPKKRCPVAAYRKKTELGRELIELVDSWTVPQCRLIVLGDQEYASRPVVLGLPERITFIGSMLMTATVFDKPGPYSGQGRRRKKGERLLSPQQLIRSRRHQWTRQVLRIYGRDVEVMTKSQVCLWYHVAGTRAVHMIVTRDPRGRIKDRAYFSTDETMSVAELAWGFSLRWSQEEMHRNVKQHLGLEDPQNGWWRRPAGHRAKKKKAGPQPHKHRGKKAVERTVPFVLVTYDVVVLWYLLKGDTATDIARSRRLRPWYLHKATVSFGDMLWSLRRELWRARLFINPEKTQGREKVVDLIEGLLLVD